MGQPRVLILGHSFIRRLRDFIVKNAPDYHLNLNLTDLVIVQWHDVGGRTIAKVRQFDLDEEIRSVFGQTLYFSKSGPTTSHSVGCPC